MNHEPPPDPGRKDAGDGARDGAGPLPMTGWKITPAIGAFAAVAIVAWLLAAPLAMPALAAVAAGLVAAALVRKAPAHPARSAPLAVPADAPPAPTLPDHIQEVIDAVDDALLILDGQLIRHANAAARRLFGDEKVEGDFRLALRHPVAADLILSGRETDSPIEIAGIGDADRRWVMSVRRIADGGRLITLRDRTDLWIAERMRVDFVANASHELRTPLATIIGFVETLGEGGGAEDPAIRQRFLDIMMGEAKRMQQLVDDLISLSRIEADRFSAPQTPLALGPLIEEVADTIRSGQLHESGDRIRTNLAAVPEVRADRVQIAQLLHNLIGNSLKYARPGTPILVTLDRDAGKVRLRVEDAGEGIASEHLPRLTERFYRVDAGRSRSIGGTGLGLAIVKHIAERHRATLDIASTVGRGTIVTVTFPAAAPDIMSS